MPIGRGEAEAAIGSIQAVIRPASAAPLRGADFGPELMQMAVIPWLGAPAAAKELSGAVEGQA